MTFYYFKGKRPDLSARWNATSGGGTSSTPSTAVTTAAAQAVRDERAREKELDSIKASYLAYVHYTLPFIIL